MQIMTSRSAEQEAHYAAAVSHEVKRTELTILMANIPDAADGSDAELERYVDAQMAAEDACGYNESRNALHAAEEALISWAVATIARKHGDAPVLAMIPPMRRSVSARPKLIELCARLEG